jgi:hypothetical protein
MKSKLYNNIKNHVLRVLSEQVKREDLPPPQLGVPYNDQNLINPLIQLPIYQGPSATEPHPTDYVNNVEDLYMGPLDWIIREKGDIEALQHILRMLYSLCNGEPNCLTLPLWDRLQGLLIIVLGSGGNPEYPEARELLDELMRVIYTTYDGHGVWIQIGGIYVWITNDNGIYRFDIHPNWNPDLYGPPPTPAVVIPYY